MINAKKGTAHSLQQSDFVGATKTGEAVVAGMLVRKNTNGEIVKGVTSQAGAVDDRLGFAINNQTDSDVIAVGKIGAYGLDGNSVVETDQVVGTINATNFPIGKRVSASATVGEEGKVKAWATSDLVIGTVDGIRELFVGQTKHTLLGIKLA